MLEPGAGGVAVTRGEQGVASSPVDRRIHSGGWKSNVVDTTAV